MSRDSQPDTCERQKEYFRPWDDNDDDEEEEEEERKKERKKRRRKKKKEEEEGGGVYLLSQIKKKVHPPWPPSASPLFLFPPTHNTTQHKPDTHKSKN